jgi:integrase/recombinase XerD
METLFAQFIREKQYLKNVSPRTMEGYKWAWKQFGRCLAETPAACKAQVIRRIAELREAGLRPVTVNTYLRTVNTYFRWLHTEGYAETLVKIPRLKEEQAVVPAFTSEQVAALLRYVPRTISSYRAQVISALILDTGLRIDEVLSIDRAQDLDYDQLLLTVRKGKGAKGRVVPFTLQLRKILIRFTRKQVPDYGTLLFYSGKGDSLGQRNALRDFKLLCQGLLITGTRCSFHTLRHTFATSYLRNGGDVFRLQRILGHAKLDMTRRYVSIQSEDLREVHHRLSPLSNH